MKNSYLKFGGTFLLLLCGFNINGQKLVLTKDSTVGYILFYLDLKDSITNNNTIYYTLVDKIPKRMLKVDKYKKCPSSKTVYYTGDNNNIKQRYLNIIKKNSRYDLFGYTFPSTSTCFRTLIMNREWILKDTSGFKEIFKNFNETQRSDSIISDLFNIDYLIFISGYFDKFGLYIGFCKVKMSFLGLEFSSKKEKLQFQYGTKGSIGWNDYTGIGNEIEVNRFNKIKAIATSSLNDSKLILPFKIEVLKIYD
ncbi:MAG: hypothetical protein WCP69_10225 [Bacteroidota bacterium]